MYFCRIRSSLIFFLAGETWNILNRKYHVFVYFLRKVISLIFHPVKKYHVFEETIPHFQIGHERSYPSVILLEKTIFSEHLKKISYFHVIFLRKIIFHFPSGGKIIFLGKRNIFPDNTRKIIFQRNFFGKTIFSGRLEKENMVFRAVK